MKSNVYRTLPPPVRRGLEKLGTDIGWARRRRRLTEAMMAERLGVSLSTYRRLESGNPAAGIGLYALALFVLGLDAPFADLADAGRDDQGLLLEAARLPKRVRVRRESKPL
ncbi:MAG: helix-turn-helix domain-containing protein [bacterium]